jgi:hypothetical protein
MHDDRHADQILAIAEVAAKIRRDWRSAFVSLERAPAAIAAAIAAVEERSTQASHAINRCGLVANNLSAAALVVAGIAEAAVGTAEAADIAR